MYYVGCDQHKKYSFVVVKDQTGKTLDQTKLYHADKENMKDYFNALPKDSIVALETCGFDHWLTDMLQDLVRRSLPSAEYSANGCSMRLSRNEVEAVAELIPIIIGGVGFFSSLENLFAILLDGCFHR